MNILVKIKICLILAIIHLSKNIILNKTQKMCDKAVDYLLPLKFVPDWFVMSTLIEKRDNAVFSNYDMVFASIDSVIFLAMITRAWDWCMSLEKQCETIFD